MKRLIGLTALCAIAGIGCGDDDGPGPMPDGSTDGPIIMIDGGPMVDSDGGPMVDSGPRPDVPTATTSIGDRCTAARGCPGPGEDCLDESTNTVGGTGDPIMGAPAEIASGLTTSSFLEGYCIVRDCDLDAEDAGDAPCGPGATCLEAAENFGVCFADCGVPTSADNGTCRDGYDCVAGSNVCLPGCTEDAECRIIREETNGIPGIQAPSDCPADCEGSSTNFDRLRWIPESETDIACDANTSRCEFTGAAGSSAGDACEQDWDCEANGFCFTDAAGTAPEDAFWGEDGFCSKRGCNEMGNGCAAGGTCASRLLPPGVLLCMPTCTLGAGSNPEDPATWLANNGGCDDGQVCLWSGAATETNNGYCLPGGNNNDVTVENVGGTCESEDDCWSPFGQGECRTRLFVAADEPDDLPNGYCTVFDCGAYGTGTCGEDNLCVSLGSGEAPVSLCFQGCETAADCQEGLGCTAITEGEAKVCFPGCSETADCRTGETCVGASAMELGACE